MENAVEHMFERVLSQLPAEPEGPEGTEMEDDLDGNAGDQMDSPPDAEGVDALPINRSRARGRYPDRGTETVQQPSEEQKELFESGVETRGFEAIAFYKSRRFVMKDPFPGKWGIFYINEGLNYVAWEISQLHPNFKNPKSLAITYLTNPR